MNLRPPGYEPSAGPTPATPPTHPERSSGWRQDSNTMLARCPPGGANEHLWCEPSSFAQCHFFCSCHGIKLTIRLQKKQGRNLNPLRGFCLPIGPGDFNLVFFVSFNHLGLGFRQLRSRVRGSEWAKIPPAQMNELRRDSVCLRQSAAGASTRLKFREAVDKSCALPPVPYPLSHPPPALANPTAAPGTLSWALPIAPVPLLVACLLRVRPGKGKSLMSGLQAAVVDGRTNQNDPFTTEAQT